MELNTAKMLNDLDIDCQMPEDMMEKRLRAVEEKEKIELDPLQHKAVIRVDQAWTSDPDRRSGNRKDYDDQYNDPVFRERGIEHSSGGSDGTCGKAYD